MSGSVVVLENFFDFELHFIQFLRGTMLFNNVRSAHFLIYDAEFTQISYKYDYLVYKEFVFEEVKEGMKRAKSLSKVGYVEFLTLKLEIVEVNGIREQLVINVFNSVLDNVLIATVIIYMDHIPNMESIKTTFNAHYFEQLCYHIQMIIANYEKLYYIIDAYTELLMAKDKFMPYHMSNVANWCVKLSTELNINEKDSMILYISALLHDIGKLFVSDIIINKPGKLTDEEFKSIRSHPEKGAQIIRAAFYGMTLLDEVPKIIKHHHEHYDGTGYPFGLKGEDIPYLSRVLTVADSVDAMLSRRAYKGAFLYHEIIEELKTLSGVQYDKNVVDAMLNLIDHQVDENKPNSFSGSSFIAQSSLTFYYKNIHDMRSFNGNLVLNKNKGHFICHDLGYDLKTLNLDEVYRTTISFFDMRDFVEYKVEIESVKDDKFYLKSFIHLPTDKLFSMVWSGKVQIFNEAVGSVEANYVKLGGDSIVFEVNEEKSHFILDHFGDKFVASIKEIVTDVVVDLNIAIRVLKFYKINSGYVIVAKYLELPAGDKDHLLRLLFRKQIEIRKGKNQLIHKA